MTVLEIIQAVTPEKLQACVDKLEPSLHQLIGLVSDHSVRLGRPQLNFDDGAVSMTFIPVGKDDYTYLHLRRDLANLCNSNGVEVASRYFTTSSHITIARFVYRDALTDLPSRERWVDKIKHLNESFENRLWLDGDHLARSWVIGADRGVEVRMGRLWYGGGKTIA